MGRRTKEELKASNYYEWLEAKALLQKKKKEGFKLTKEEKALVRLNPTPDKPYVGTRGSAAPPKLDRKLGPIPTGNEVWEVKGGAFYCTCRKMPVADEECMLFCTVDACPYYSFGYTRMRNLP